jgi:DNA-directed RNA polymerase specialized sigma24 family protein
VAKRTNGNSELQVRAPADLLERIVNLAALLVVRGESQTNQILMLAGSGFSSSEIANLLGTTTNTVSVTLYQARSSRKPKKKKA